MSDAQQGSLGGNTPSSHETGGPDFDLLRAKGFGADLPGTARWLPWFRAEGTLWIATAEPVTPRLRTEVAASLGESEVDFVTVSSKQLRETEQRLREVLRDEASEKFAREHPSYSAKAGLRRWQSGLPALALMVTTICWLLDWRQTIVVLFGIGNVFFFVNVIFKTLSAVFHPLRRARERKFAEAEERRFSATPDISQLSDELSAEESRSIIRSSDLPIYTILVPVYKEATVVASILRSFERLEYPRDKLDVLVLLEEDDTETIKAAQAATPPAWIRLVMVPRGQPRTKPRACNFGLLFARGDYVVIYDAEDRPDPDQLVKALISFRHDSTVQSRRAFRRPLACVQASLNFYNVDYNVLTRMFAIEYAQWFDSMLPGLDSLNIPMPLGGTSNHFERQALISAGGWDPYNVTEDADLGMRLAASGYRVNVVHSTTWEEATPRIIPWIHQRTRWTKGYLVTAAVNLRSPLRWLRRNGMRSALTMGALILGTPLSFLFYPLTLGFTLVSWLLGPLVQIWIPHPLLLFGTFNMVVMTGLMVISASHAAWRRYDWRTALFAVFLPVYWLLHSVAAWRAVFQLIWSPSSWEKTPHGLTEEYDDSMLNVTGLAHTAWE
jgi:cellulose synthase/poly-beta-1,6-N-acetylglucosamine synthase-like glycosyltransferase